MKKIFFLGHCNYFLIVLLIAFVCSCSKDEVTTSQQNSESSQISKSVALGSSEILTFKDSKEYMERLIKVNSMLEEQRKLFEESEGYLSFGRECMEFYNSLNSDEFTGAEEIRLLVDANRKFLHLIEEDNGDLTLEPTLFRNPNKYIVNNDRMFKIGNKLYKALEMATVSSDEKNAEILKRIDENNVKQYENNPEFRIEYIEDKTQIHKSPKNWEENCGTYAYGEQIDGRDKTTMGIYCLTSGENMELYIRILIRAYKKTLGVWWLVNRTITLDIDFRADMFYRWNPEDPIVWDQGFCGIVDCPECGWFTKEMDLWLDQDTNIPAGCYDYSYHFGGYNGWGRTPSAPPVEFSCNSYIF